MVAGHQDGSSVFREDRFRDFQNTHVAGLRGSAELWNRWDAPEYLHVAQFGYDDGRALVCYPLFPWL